ncbi:muconate/chloromuconate family cycloisomerase [Sphingomonas sp. ERG5]|uniref:muconate/chloromuconate family cycloisomerase n=1 Tax=Sphingomonas sp. ERG5 TaxID=1381597 RepID=UPI00054C3C09|nr:muconate/chloromuconate family cycloisomerase [Sphingomonas sp. ERG5]
MATGTRISAIDVLIADIPTVRPHVLAMTTMHTQAVVLVFIRRDDGLCGIGEATTIGGLAYGEESPEGIRAAINTYFAPLVVGEDGDRPAAIMARIEAAIIGNRFAKCAIETALLDALGQARGLPLSELLGGRRRDRLPVAWTLASGETERDIAEGEAMIDARRHNIFKLKIGKRPVTDDCAHVAAIARAFEGRASIRVDVNQHWSRANATDGMARLQNAGVVLVEQPIAAGDIEGMQALCRRFDMAVMADEALSGPASAWRFVREQAADVLSLKITQSGGLNAARDVATIARAGHVALYGGTMLEAAIGTAASAHLFAALPALEWGSELFGPLLLTEEILTEPLVYRDFALEVPSGAGLGVRLDEDKLRYFARGKD